MSEKHLRLMSNSPEETREIARKIGSKLPAGTVIAARGDLGAGKTLFAGALAQALGVTETVTSPTFIFFREYQGRIPFAHVDAYRLEGLEEEEIALTGVDDALTREKVAFVEWPDFIRDRLPASTVWLEIRRCPDNDTQRSLEFSYDDDKEAWLDEALGH